MRLFKRGVSYQACLQPLGTQRHRSVDHVSYLQTMVKPSFTLQGSTELQQSGFGAYMSHLSFLLLLTYTDLQLLG